MEIRTAQPADVPRIMEIYAHAREFMASHGNPNQWGPTHWPPEELIRSDIASRELYVCTDGGRPVGVFFYRCGFDAEPGYGNIRDGAWLDDGAYGVIHRLASDGSVRGVGGAAIDWAWRRCRHIRIDTHGDNTVMQNLLAKYGFVRCGTVYVEEDDAPRLAFEKTARVMSAEEIQQ